MKKQNFKEIISEYCKNHQTKPFSHIVMDLFKETLRKYKSKKESERTSLKRSISSPTEGHRSDTDSGRSSDVENIRKIPNASYDSQTENYAIPMMKPPLKPLIETEHPRELKVTRSHIKYSSLPRPTVIGYDSSSITKSHQKILEEDRVNPVTRKHPVVRKINEAVRKRFDARRNTIDVNHKDLRMAEETLHDIVIGKTKSNGVETNFSKSTNHLDKVGQFEESDDFMKKIDALSFDNNNKNGLSLPDLTMQKIYVTQQNLRVRRHKSVRDDVQRLMPPISKESFTSKAPEFITNALLPIKQLDISDTKCQQKRNLNVLLIDGTKITMTCNPITTTARQVFEAVIKMENLTENFFLGLCALVGGDFVFLPMDLKIYKIAPQIWINLHKKSVLSENVTFPLFLRVKFYLPTLRGVSSLNSRHLLYLQLRKNVLEQQILCTEDDLITLGGLGLQAEIGDFKESMRQLDYFTISHYIPEKAHPKQHELAKYLRNAHYCKKGMHNTEAEHNFIRYMQELKEYGMHLYSAVWLTDDNLNLEIYVAISLKGVTLFERNVKNVLTRNHNEYSNSKDSFQRHVYAQFEWLEIENICYTKHVLCIIVRKTVGIDSKSKAQRVKYKFRMDGRKSYFAFSLASDHHRFYMKLRNSFVSMKALADELNMPLIEPKKRFGSERYKITIDGENYAPISATNVDKIDKPLKSTGLRVRNLKKSMLNDNRLMKLKQKFLRRTKSSAAATSVSTSFLDEHKEENQNKENECPRSLSNVSDLDTSGKIRNKVKMGTRVFSAQFLNKSFDNIHDHSLDTLRINPIGSCTDVRSNRLDRFDIDPLYMHEEDDEEISSIKSTSATSDFTVFDSKTAPYVNLLKASDERQEACVIQTSIKSLNHNFNPFMKDTNETISESLLEKFQNLTGAVVYDRVIKRVYIIKEPNTRKNLNAKDNEDSYVAAMGKYFNNLANEQINDQRKLAEKSFNIENTGDYTLGISIVQGSDANVYVKDIVIHGPGDRAGVKIGDQILAVNGISLLNIPYDKSIKILQETPRQCELIISQIFCTDTTTSIHQGHNQINNNLITATSPYCHYLNNLLMSQQKKKSKSIGNINEKSLMLGISSTPNNSNNNNEKIPDQLLELENNVPHLYSSACALPNINHNNHHNENDLIGEKLVYNVDEIDVSAVMELQKMGSLKHFHKYPIGNLTPSKSLPELVKITDLVPKVSNNLRPALPRSMGLSRKYIGPVRYPVTPPAKEFLKVPSTTSSKLHQLSLLAESGEEQVFI